MKSHASLASDAKNIMDARFNRALGAFVGESEFKSLVTLKHKIIQDISYYIAKLICEEDQTRTTKKENNMFLNEIAKQTDYVAGIKDVLYKK